MSLYVFPTERFFKDTQKDGTPSDKVLALAADLEESQSTDRFATFSYPYLIKTQWDYQRRLIAAEVEHDGHLVLVFLRLLVRGSQEFERFSNDPRGFMQSTLDDALAELPAWFAQRTAVSPPPVLPAASPAQLEFLWSHRGGSEAAETIVCEAAAWVEATREQRIRDRLVLLPNMLLGLLGGSSPCAGTAECSADPRLKVAYRWLPPSQEGVGRLLLLTANYGSTPDIVVEERKLLSDGGSIDHTNVTRIARRSYPAEVCCDEDLWMDIQRDEASNLSLSPEEADLLESVRLADASGGFPMFINGRAGSGKSTLLQYVFADYFRAWLNHVETRGGDSSSVPLYLAASHDLLRNAERHVRGLLTANAMQVMQTERLQIEQLALLSGAFQTPEQYLLERLEEKDTPLPIENRVNYPRFRQLWQDRFGLNRNARRDFGPQVSWHVIRTHIKGQSIDGLLEPDEYDDLPRNEQTVTRERYRNVFHRVWKGWFEDACRQQNLWDDQDLALLLTQSGWQGNHCALFCDEAQDFTRRQLEALRRCCVFSFLSLSPQEAERVPLVFAGDPFQTLNPTGFRWAAVRAAFTEKLAANMRRYTRRDQIPDIRYRELTFNYRSADQIVRFCNTLQAIRATYMDETGLRPQMTWHLDGTAALPSHFRIDDPSFAEALSEQKDLILIVPCEEDEEAEYVTNHPVLNNLVQRDENGTPQNVLSPIRAKGLEFNRVAVVGFASTEEAKALAKAIREKVRVDDTIDTKLPLEYFLNKLYVACSRARKRLFIVDETSALGDFWGFAAEHDKVEQLAAGAPGGAEVWRDSLGVLAMGNPSQWGDDHGIPGDTAKRYEDEGEDKRDPYLLLQAALQYDHVGQPQKAADCRGRAFEYDRKPARAGEWFLKAGKTARAIENFWEAGSDTDVVATADRDPSLRARLEYRLSALLCGSDESRVAPLDLLREVIDRAGTDVGFRARLGRPEWSRAVRTLLQKAHQRLAGSADSAAWGQLADMYRYAGNLGVGSTNDQQADALLNAGRFEEVVTLPGLPAGSSYVRRARFRLLTAREAADPKASFTVEEAQTVADEYMQTARYEEAVPWCTKAGSSTDLETILAKATKSDALPLGALAARALVSLIVARPDWTDLPSLIEGRIGRTRSPHTEAFVRRVFQRDHILEEVLLPACAFSDGLPLMAPTLKERILTPLRTVQPQPHGPWTDDFQHHVRLYGAAIERLGKDIDALEYYERIMGEKTIPEPLLHYCEKRWIQCKKRQEQRERFMGRRATADRHFEAIEGKLRTYRWTANDLGPEYPDRRTVGRSQPLGTGSKDSRDRVTSPTTAQLGDYTIQTFPAARRVNVVSTETGDIVRIDLAGRRVTSAEVRVVEGGHGTWTVPDWDVSIAMDPLDSRLSIQANDTSWTAPASLTETVATTVGARD